MDEKITRTSKQKDICRTCLTDSERLESIYEVQENISFKEMLASFCTIRLEKDDISSLICVECSKETLRAYNFKLKCEKSDEILRKKYLASSKNVLPSVDEDTPLDRVLKKERLEDDAVKHEVAYESNLLEFTIKWEREDCVSESEGLDNDGFLFDDDGMTTMTLRSEKPKRGHRKKDRVERKKGRKKKKISEERVKQTKYVEDAKKKDVVCESSGHKRIYECPKCHTFIKTFNMMRKHMVKLHQTIVDSVGDFDTLCRHHDKQDNKVFKQELDTKSDGGAALSPLKKPGFLCVDCQYVSKSFDTMKVHLIKHRGERHIYCDECEYKCTHLTMLVRHKRIHTGERRFPCPQCTYRAPSSFQLGLHQSTMHSEDKPFVCDACPYSSKTKISLMNHIARKHVNKRAHVCPTCGKGFNMPRDLRNHIIIHTGAKPHVCEHCGMGFTQKSNLEKHVVVVHEDTGERPHQCPHCPYRGKTIYTLKSHSVKHSAVKPFKCDMCDHRTTSKFALKVHMRRHLGDKRHSCLSCSYSCYDTETLRAHIRIHTGERPFPCELCSYRSRTKQRLRNHMKSHLNEQKFACQHCPYRSNYKSNLIVHIRKNCGKDTRPYSTRKSTAAIDFTNLPPDLPGGLVPLKTEPQNQNNSETTFQQKL